MHLMIDGYGANRIQMESENFVRNFLNEFPPKVDLHKLMEPKVLRYVGEKPDDWGISGFVIIAESHISVHTFPERSYVNIDVFSCMDFAPEKILKEIRTFFDLKQVDSWFVERGIVYPHHQEKMTDIVKLERQDFAGPASISIGNGKRKVTASK
ncbi:MAG: S-adenosylmethionine decarboxylase proenzyme [Dehalococcoidia bacterium]|nr:S-adenosylmethionine decarboxylase proenzyme [Dehalococcoidia bacterium]